MLAEPFLSRFAPAHHNCRRGPLGASQFPSHISKTVPPAVQPRANMALLPYPLPIRVTLRESLETLMPRQAAEPHLKDGGIYRKRWWATGDSNYSNQLSPESADRVDISALSQIRCVERPVGEQLPGESDVWSGTGQLNAEEVSGGNFQALTVTSTKEI